jgi:hypothetical protein
VSTHRGLDWPTIIARASALTRDETARVGVPPTLRRCHYLLVSDTSALAAGYTNTPGAYNCLGRVTARLRDDGTFPALSDRTRSISAARPTEPDPAAILQDAARWHRTDRE